MVRGPNVALFKKMMALLNPEEQKKSHQKNLKEMGKKIYGMALNKIRFTIFPFFGPLTTKGWRPLLYTVHTTSIDIVIIK